MADVRIVTVAPAEFGPAALSELVRVISGTPEPVIGLATGRTPVPLYEAMVRQQFAFPTGSRLFALDEYCYPVPHAGTNKAFFQRWLSCAGFPAVALPRHDAADPGEEIGRYCERVRSAGGLTVAIVGIGANGHIAFNEPGSTEASPCRVVELEDATRAQVAGYWQPAPTHGMTIGMDHILAAEHVLLLANGAGKSAILASALKGPETPAVPASYLRRHLRCTLVCDAAAAADLAP